jgi:hypothetical protein
LGVSRPNRTQVFIVLSRKRKRSASYVGVAVLIVLVSAWLAAEPPAACDRPALESVLLANIFPFSGADDPPDIKPSMPLGQCSCDI